jgi:prepilin-type processing-associated H-X9-DG protein
MYYLKLLQQNSHDMNSYIPSPKTGQQVLIAGGAGTYGYNMYFSGIMAYNGAGVKINSPTADQYNFRRAEIIKNTSSLPMFCDMAVEPYFEYRGKVEFSPPPIATDIGGWLMIPYDPHSVAYNYGWKGGWCSYGPAPVHQGKINYTFADGHVESKKLWPWDDVEDYKGIYDRMHYFHPQGTDEFY